VALFVIYVRALQAERLMIGREGLGHARIDEVSAALLQVMKRDADEADSVGQIGGPPRQAARLVIKPSRKIPASRGLAMTGVLRTVDGTAAQDLDRNGVFVLVDLRFQRAIKSPE